MQNRITLVFTTIVDQPNNRFETIYDIRSFTVLGDAVEIKRVYDQAIYNDEAHEIFETIEDKYGTLDIGGSGEDFLWGFQTTGETEPKDFDTITQMVRDFFASKFGASLSETTGIITRDDPSGAQ